MLFNKAETIDFLTTNDKIMSHWRQLSLTEEQVESFFTLLRSDILQSTNTKDQLDSLAKGIATERFIKKMSMDDFINTITSGRSILITEVLSLGSSNKEKSELLHGITHLLDQFIHLTLTHYSHLQAKSLEEQYYFISQTHKDRLTLLGQMTSSFVHEFRNPLTSIMGFIQLLQSEQPTIKYLDIISKELQQLNNRITQFLNFSKKENTPSTITLFSISQLIHDVIEFLYPSILEVNASISCNITSDINLTGSKEEIRQVLLNIILNALDVISAVPSPAIFISCAQSPLNHLILTISNNGPKIPEDVLPTIFEPFVTTKKQGTGLGLFVCKEIIEKHGGTLTCTSSDLLTTFTIHLPS